MNRTFKEVISRRRSYYALSNGSSIPDREIEEILEFVIRYMPSAYNSQTTRLVLLLGDEHRKVWDIVKECLRKKVTSGQFEQTEQKINRSFASGYGTVLFFEDRSIVQSFQTQFPTYEENFPVWAQHTSAMHQLAVWAMLEDVGFGASLQHYNPLIDAEVKQTWQLPEEWALIAQMPFGLPVKQPAERVIMPVEERIKVFK